MLYGVGGGEPMTLIVVATILALVAISAAYVPARRATRVDRVFATVAYLYQSIYIL